MKGGLPDGDCCCPREPRQCLSTSADDFLKLAFMRHSHGGGHTAQNQFIESEKFRLLPGTFVYRSADNWFARLFFQT